MKTLILIRHAKSSRDNPMLDDVDRPLSRRGCRDAQKAAKQFARSGCTPDLLVSSSARRARETAGIFVQKLALSPELIQFDPRIYEAERAELIRLMHEFDDQYNTVMLVGHNPGITDLFHHLLDSNLHHLPAGSIAVIELPAAGWRDVACNTGRLEQFICLKGEKLQLINADDDAALPLTIWQKIFFWRMQFDRKFELFGFFLVCLALVLGVVLLLMGRITTGSGEAAHYQTYHMIEGETE
jgi:phosphohistidine phosphatase